MSFTAWSVVAGETPTAAKWNLLGSNDQSFNDGTGIGAGAISSPEKLMVGAGTSWPWQSWTPTWTNLTVTGSTVTAKYVQIGKTVFYRLCVVLGGGNAPSGDVSFTLPVTSVSYPGTSTIPTIGEAKYYITYAYCGSVVWKTITTASFRLYNTDYTFTQYPIDKTISATVPNVFTNGSEIHASGSYEAA